MDTNETIHPFIPPFNFDTAKEIYHLPFNELLFRAHSIHRHHFNPNEIQLSRLISIKTGACPEDCAYCSQSVHSYTGLKASKLMNIDQVIADASIAKKNGATRYCMGSAGRSPKDRDLDAIIDMIKGVKALGMETCVTLGMLSSDQAQRLAAAGLDYYNHNIDTSERFYSQIITTRMFSDRLNTLNTIREAGIKTCCGGILGMGESIDDRINMLVTLASLPEYPESVPINMLIPITGTKCADAPPIDTLDFVRIIALARILMPTSRVRLSAGRMTMSDEAHALCFFAGANSIFIGDTLLTTDNPEVHQDMTLFARLGITPAMMDTTN